MAAAAVVLLQIVHRYYRLIETFRGCGCADGIEHLIQRESAGCLPCRRGVGLLLEDGDGYARVGGYADREARMIAALRQARANPVLRASLVWHVLPPCVQAQRKCAAA